MHGIVFLRLRLRLRLRFWAVQNNRDTRRQSLLLCRSPMQ